MKTRSRLTLTRLRWWPAAGCPASRARRRQRVDFRFRDFPRIDAGDAAAVEVHLHHDAVRLGRRLLEHRLEHVDDELHGRVVVVEQDDAVERRLLGFLADAFLDRVRRSGPDDPPCRPCSKISAYLAERRRHSCRSRSACLVQTDGTDSPRRTAGYRLCDRRLTGRPLCSTRDR